MQEVTNIERVDERYVFFNARVRCTSLFTNTYRISTSLQYLTYSMYVMWFKFEWFDMLVFDRLF